MNDKITLSVAGKFHAVALAKEYAKLNALDGIYCINKNIMPPDSVKYSQYHNKVTLGLWQFMDRYIPQLKFSHNKKASLFDDFMAKKIEKIQPGVIHTWNGCSYKTLKKASQLGWKTCIERSCPHNQVQYDLLMEEADNLGLHFYENSEILKKNIEELYLADKIICPSIYSSSSYTDQELVKKLCVVPLGGNYKYRERKEKKDQTLRILMVGNNFLRKGTHYLVESMKYIDNPKAELWIRGEVPVEYRKNIKDSRIKIFDSLSLNKLILLYESADVFVQPSIDEGFGMTVLEALSFGLPIVLTENVGAKDILNDLVCSSVSIKSPEALAVAILNAKNMVNENFDLVRKDILLKYSWGFCASQLMAKAYSIIDKNL